MNKSLALVHLAPDAGTPGTRLDAIAERATYAATVEPIHFFDPEKSRTHVPWMASRLGISFGCGYLAVGSIDVAEQRLCEHTGELDHRGAR